MWFVGLLLFFFSCLFWCSDFGKFRLETIMHDDSSRFRSSTGYVFMAEFSLDRFDFSSDFFVLRFWFQDNRKLLNARFVWWLFGWHWSGFPLRVVSGILPAIFFIAESKFVLDLNFDFFLFEHLPPFLIVDFCFWTLDFNSSFVYKVEWLGTAVNVQGEEVI